MGQASSVQKILDSLGNRDRYPLRPGGVFDPAMIERIDALEASDAVKAGLHMYGSTRLRV